MKGMIPKFRHHYFLSLVPLTVVTTRHYELSLHSRDGSCRNFANSTRDVSNEEDIIIVDKFSGLRDDYQTPKYPIVLCHGFSGFDRLFIVPPIRRFLHNFNISLNQSFGKTAESVGKELAEENGGFYFNYWHGIKEALDAKGCTVLVARVPPFGSIEERANALNKFIETKIIKLRQDTKDDANLIYHEEGKDSGTDKNPKDEPIKVNLIAHSMGGLDARYLISKIEQKNYKVMSLTTISSPHHGSGMADYIINNFKLSDKEVKQGPLQKIIPRSIFELTTDYVNNHFNKEVPDDSNVKYFSYGSRFVPSFYNVFYFSWKIIYETQGDNDGMVGVESSKWGKYLGTLENVDHLDLINWTNTIRKYYSEAILGEKPKFNAVALYLDIIDNLAKEGL
ncbi:hypothetical protein PACTADRAFT_49931 [Pachysolen tannophilus NRRL Y-2460]|uniref:GPI inositol-deacylase n=1 Tax=Pachysolen tannophilus NRRL Y-2460 TaxID=669874 RepID=A0A1E4TTR0_PACTA|nr:hypothetical protein PACTADRAFT_49931 [Pachysolen tannophilus NRRL Y-2460]